jgi:acetoin utilization deacetylase AcuC-like enzyme
MKIGIIQDPLYIEHNPGQYHPESPERLIALYKMLKEGDVSDIIHPLQPRKATREEIQRNHTSEYYDQVAKTAGISFSFLDSDTQTSEKSFEAALLAAGGILVGIDKIMEGDLNTVFALVRPPGHHAESNRGMGFCLFNNVAVGALYALDHYSIERIVIVDWDLHHGNGTQHSFYNDNRVLYFSTHQYPYYPGTGDFNEVGEKEGKGFTINVPLGVGHGDTEYVQIFKRILVPVTEMYNPQLIIVSAGFDIYFRDPLGGMAVTSQGFAALTQILQDVAGRKAENRLLFALEGGYHLEGLCQSVKAVIQQLAGKIGKDQLTDKSIDLDNVDKLGTRSNLVIDKVISIQKKFWNNL